MSWLMNLVLILIATAVVAWVFRFAGQKFTRFTQGFQAGEEIAAITHG